jgi:hypothetical protein
MSLKITDEMLRAFDRSFLEECERPPTAEERESYVVDLLTEERLAECPEYVAWKAAFEPYKAARDARAKELYVAHDMARFDYSSKHPDRDNLDARNAASAAYCTQLWRWETETPLNPDALWAKGKLANQYPFASAYYKAVREEIKAERARNRT